MKPSPRTEKFRSRPIHLVSDLDGTWLSKAGQPEDLQHLEEFLEVHPEFTLTFATGRTFESALEAISPVVGRMPEHLVTDVGTTIHHRSPDGNWIEDKEYPSIFDACWDESRVEDFRMFWLPKGVRLQEGVEPRRRIALEFLPNHDRAQVLRELEHGLADVGLTADLLPSAETCLDVLPKGVHKGTAVRFMQERGMVPDFVIACGDTENDLGLFQVADRSILMADSLLDFDTPGMPRGQVIRATSPGPGGILEVLLLMEPEMNLQGTRVGTSIWRRLGMRLGIPVKTAEVS